MKKQELTPRQLEILKALSDGEWKSSIQLGTNRQVLTPLARRGLVLRKMVQSSPGLPESGCLYKLNPDKRIPA